jgi:hypothetical protein
MELDTQVESALAVLNTTLDTAASAEPDSREFATARDRAARDGAARDGAARDGATAAATHSGARDGALATLAAASLALDLLITGARDGAVNGSSLQLVLNGLARTAGSPTAELPTAELSTAGSLEERRRPAISTAISTAGRASARFLSELAPELDSSAAAEVSSAAAEVSSAAAEVSSAAAEVSSAAAEVSSAAAEVSSRSVVSVTAEDVAGLAEQLMSEMSDLFREYADEAGHVGRHELHEIGSAPRFAELSAKTALLGRVDLSCTGPLGAHDDARLAFWLNVYNLICMQGFAANARQVPSSESTLAVLRMHSSFVYNIGGFSISAIEIEHAILRASKPRPSFFIAFLIPKFSSHDPRRALAFSRLPSPLLSFGLVAGTAFSPPLRAYSAGAVHTQLAMNARAVLATTIEVLDTTPFGSTSRSQWHASAHHGATSLFPIASPQVLDTTPSRLHLSLPAQLRWHRADVGASVLDALTGPVLRPLLPPRIAGLLGAPAGLAPATAPATVAKTRWSNMSWLVRFEFAPVGEEYV